MPTEEECEELEDFHVSAVVRKMSGEFMRIYRSVDAGKLRISDSSAVPGMFEDFEAVPAEPVFLKGLLPGASSGKGAHVDATARVALRTVSAKSGYFLSGGTLTCILDGGLLVTAHHVVEGVSINCGKTGKRAGPVAQKFEGLGGDLVNGASLKLEVAVCLASCNPGVSRVTLVPDSLAFDPTEMLPKRVWILGRRSMELGVVGMACAKVRYSNGRRIDLHEQILLDGVVEPGTSGALVVSSNNGNVVGMVVARGRFHTVVTPWSAVSAAIEAEFGSVEFLKSRVLISC